MKSVPRALRVVFLAVGILLVIMIFLSFFPPLVPVSRVNIDKTERIPIPKVVDYLETKLVMGLVPTTNSIFDDAKDTLGPLLEDVTIKRHFFFSATVTIKEKKETYNLKMNAGKVAVDVEGRIVDSIRVSEDAPVEMEVAYLQPGGYGMLDASFYNDKMAPVVAQILKYKKLLPVKIKTLFYNKSEYVTSSGSRGGVFLAPVSYPDGIAKAMFDGKYKRAYLESMQGFYAETSQGTLIVFGLADEFMDVRFGALSHYLKSLGNSSQLPAVIKLDVPYQVTTCPY
ncbi:MAG TPA: hypothetical protein PLX04_05875 [Caldisericia bacterium]|nr:hypothetical protein [Caldisericia bacterium]HOU07785.1 hypothetical protein [Caldisericia bacterium]HPL89757.1 hypothetical protein [Caldisericia bacterium]HQG59355.1 hypothetical protein [Caldisericia bacterium]HQH48413.1 hypothetical protein [Caldisericia bacterium]